MKRVKTALLAGLALVAVGLVASAAASASPQILPQASEGSPISFTAKSGSGKFVSKSGVEVKCSADTAQGSMTAPTEGTFHITFTGCKGPLGVACTGLGDSPNVILVLGSVAVYDATSEPTTPVLLVYKIEPVHFECAGVLSSVRGCVAGPVTPVEELVSTGINEIKQSKGVNEFTSYLKEGKSVECILETAIGGGEYSQSGEETKETIEAFEQNGSLITVLMMR